MHAFFCIVSIHWTGSIVEAILKTLILMTIRRFFHPVKKNDWAIKAKFPKKQAQNKRTLN